MVDISPQWRAMVTDKRHATGDMIDSISFPKRATAIESDGRGFTSPFMQQASGLNKSLNDLHSLLLSQFSDYVDIARAIPSKASNMSDEERDAFDSETSALTSSFAQGIDALRVLIRQHQTQHQISFDKGSDSNFSDSGMHGDLSTLHQNICITFLMERLRAVMEILKIMQAERYRNDKIEAKGLFFMAQQYFDSTQTKSSDTLSPELLANMTQLTQEELEEEAELSKKISKLQSQFPRTESFNLAKKSVRKEKNIELKISESLPQENDEYMENKPLIQLKVLEEENLDLQLQLRDELDGARQVEEKMTEISKLMTFFATEVAEQQEEMEVIYDTAVQAHESIRRGGEHLGKAKERGTAYRTYYVCFMFVMTFALLFLHLLLP